MIKRQKKYTTFILLFAFSLFFLQTYTIIGYASEQTAADNYADELTKDAIFTNSASTSFKKAIDGRVNSSWSTDILEGTYVAASSEIPISHISIVFEKLPKHFLIQTSTDGEEWIAYKEYDDTIIQSVYVNFDIPYKNIRIYCPDAQEDKISISEIRLFSVGELPPDVQVWRDTEMEQDIMIISAHPDDEVVFFAGIIPYYSIELDKKVSVVYMSDQYLFRRLEALNCLWAQGEDAYPLFAGFADYYCKDAASAEKNWGSETTLNYFVELFRKYKPKVIVTHDIDGEYGHGQHMYTSLAVQQAVLLAADPEYHTQSAQLYGTWEANKLYIHLYEENPILMDWSIPLESFEGKTALEVAELGMQEHKSQLHWPVVRVHDGNDTAPCTEYGLFYTNVGLDSGINDMLENLPTPTPVPTPTPTPTAEPTIQPTAEPTATILLTNEPVASSEPEAQTSDNTNTIIIIIVALIIIVSLIIILIMKRRKG